MFDATQADNILNCIEKGESSYQELRNKNIIEKSKDLKDTIPKMSSKKVNPVSKRIDINKESLAALKHIDYARVRSYCVQRLLTYELADTSYFLTKDGFLRKLEKSESVREIEKKVNIASNSTIPSLDKKNIDGVIVIDFMAYSRRVPIKKVKVDVI